MTIALNAADAAQMSTAQARVVDPVLSTAARGYRHAPHIAAEIAPRVYSDLRGGQRIEFDRTSFRRINTRRAPGAKTERIQFGYEGEKFAVAQHRLMGLSPVELAQEAMREPGVDLGQHTVSGVQQLISLEREIETAELVTAAASYAPGHVVTVAPGDARWDSDDSNPTAAILKGVETVRAAIGLRPNLVAMGGSVYSVVRAHKLTLQQIRYAGEGKQIADKKDLARLWDVEKVAVGDAITVDEAGNPSDVWGKHVVICYTRPGTLARTEPTFAYTYTLTGTPFVEQPYYDRDVNSWLYPVCEEYTAEVVGRDAGYLLRTVIG